MLVPGEVTVGIREARGFGCLDFVGHPDPCMRRRETMTTEPGHTRQINVLSPKGSFKGTALGLEQILVLEHFYMSLTSDSSREDEMKRGKRRIIPLSSSLVAA